MIERKHRVFLAGFMGSGKSTIGPELARKLGYDFVDIDDLIEKSEGVTIPEIFRNHGEEYFRRIEKRVLDDLSGNDRHIVVALGGGTLTNEESRGLLREEGILVYLRSDPKEILERVKKKRDRPMLLAPDGSPLNDAELSSRVESLLREREVHYLEANIIVSTSGRTVSKSVEEIASKLKGRIL